MHYDCQIITKPVLTNTIHTQSTCLLSSSSPPDTFQLYSQKSHIGEPTFQPKCPNVSLTISDPDIRQPSSSAFHAPVSFLGTFSQSPKYYDMYIR